MTSQKQIEANRANAQKSTGPKTEEGKETTKTNATKHGILSEAVLITKGDGQESKELYHRHYQGLRAYFLPKGTMEESLVEHIAVTLWRKRRVLRFEMGCIRKQTDNYLDSFQNEDDDLPSYSSRRNKSAHARLKEFQTKAEHLRECIEAMKDSDILSDEGAEGWAENYQAVAAKINYSPDDPDAFEAPQIRDWMLKQGMTEANIRKELMKIDEDALKDAGSRIKELESRVALELDHAALLASIPSFEPDLDKIIRYEASLDRQLYKAINQLERLQRSRKGENVPPPLAIDEV